MEKDLDEIADGKLVWNKTLDDFYKKFEPLLDDAFKNMEKQAPEETGEICPECGNPLVIRNGKFGKFTACSSYPDCKYIKKEEKTIVEICDCPKCGHKIIEKKTKKGKIFYGCNNYPKCDFALWDKPTGEVCSNCGGLMVDKKNGVVCSDCGK
jgi:DNA topoisomerase-1